MNTHSATLGIFKKLLKPAVFAAFALISALPSQAQETIYNVPADADTIGVQFGLELMLADPKNEFRENIDNPGFGVGGYFGVMPGKLPVMVGAEFNYMIYGNETKSVPFNNSSVGRVNVDLTTSNNILLGHLLARLEPRTGPLRPYIEGLAGFNYLNTSSSISDDNDEEEIASSLNYQDIAFSYGGGVGAKIRVFKEDFDNSEANTSMPGEGFIDFKVRYMAGGEAEYLKPGSIKEDPNDPSKVIYDVYKSRTDMVTFQVGFVLSF